MSRRCAATNPASARIVLQPDQGESGASSVDVRRFRVEPLPPLWRRRTEEDGPVGRALAVDLDPWQQDERQTERNRLSYEVGRHVQDVAVTLSHLTCEELDELAVGLAGLADAPRARVTGVDVQVTMDGLGLADRRARRVRDPVCDHRRRRGSGGAG